MPGTQMAAEMAEQPQALRHLLARRDPLIAAVRSVVPDDVRGIVLLARGSSDHAAVYGRYVLEIASGRPVALAAPSLHTLYHAEVDYRGYLAVAVSQSGRTPEIATVLAAAQTAGATGIAITNAHDSPLADAADAVIDLQVGDERAVPATKTFTAQLAAFALMAEALGAVPWTADDWARVPDAVTAALGDPQPAARVADAIGDAPGMIVVGRGFCFGVALEIALKLKETCGLLAQGYSAADLRHGPIGVVEQAFPVLALRTSGPTYDDMSALIDELEQRGAAVHVAGQGLLAVDGGLAEALAAIPLTVRGQQVAHALALWRGLDPDRPAGLTKVTPTT